MITEDTRKILIMACQHENNKAKLMFQNGQISADTFRAVHRALEGVQVQVNIEAKK